MADQPPQHEDLDELIRELREDEQKMESSPLFPGETARPEFEHHDEEDRER